MSCKLLMSKRFRNILKNVYFGKVSNNINFIVEICIFKRCYFEDSTFHLKEREMYIFFWIFL